jgi:hypothetical protein
MEGKNCFRRTSMYYPIKACDEAFEFINKYFNIYIGDIVKNLNSDDYKPYEIRDLEYKFIRDVYIVAVKHYNIKTLDCGADENSEIYKKRKIVSAIMFDNINICDGNIVRYM